MKQTYWALVDSKTNKILHYDRDFQDMAHIFFTKKKAKQNLYVKDKGLKIIKVKITIIK